MLTWHSKLNLLLKTNIECFESLEMAVMDSYVISSARETELWGEDVAIAQQRHRESKAFRSKSRLF